MKDKRIFSSLSSSWAIIHHKNISVNQIVEASFNAYVRGYSTAFTFNSSKPKSLLDLLKKHWLMMHRTQSCSTSRISSLATKQGLPTSTRPLRFLSKVATSV